MTLDALQTALGGLQHYQRRAERAADDVVRSSIAVPEGASSSDLVDAAARLLTARRGFEACLAVASTADEMLGTLIDTLA